ncbi:MAG: metal-dependent hydrolase [Acidimicrobiia bacterium]
MLFWHVGATVAFTRYAFRDEAMDLRFLAFGAILPDLIDTPVGLMFWAQFQTVRLAAHSLMFATLLLAAVMAVTRRGRPRKRWMALAIGVLLHLIFDGMWRFPSTLWWPFLGWEFDATSFATVGAYLDWLLTDVRTWALEAVGLVYLAALAHRSDLSDPDSRRLLVTSGRVQAPIGR